MRSKEQALTVTAEATPATASTAVGSTIKSVNFLRADGIAVDALITAGSGGTLDVYLQRKVSDDNWRDWIHFAQVSAGATSRQTAVVNGQGSSVVITGGGTDATPGVALAAATAVNVIPLNDVRLVYVAGAGTSGAGAVTLTITPYTDQ